jgi:hypothetical protein
VLITLSGGTVERVGVEEGDPVVQNLPAYVPI